MDEVLQVRRADRRDLEAIVALLADDVLGAGREDARLPLDGAYRAAFVAIDGDANQILAVADVGGRIAGVLQVTFIPGLSRRGAWRGQIESVRVAADQRGTGLGEKLIRWAIGQCEARGCKLVQLTTDNTRADARRFYERLGFEATHTGMKLALA